MEFSKYVRQQIQWLESLPVETDGEWLVVSEDLRSMVSEVETQAMRAGLPKAVAACRIRSGPISKSIAREALAGCLAACDKIVSPDSPLTIQQASERFNISAPTLYSLCAKEKLPHVRIGTGRGTIRIMPSDLTEYLRQTQQGEVDYLS